MWSYPFPSRSSIYFPSIWITVGLRRLQSTAYRSNATWIPRLGYVRQCSFHSFCWNTHPWASEVWLPWDHQAERKPSRTEMPCVGALANSPSHQATQDRQEICEWRNLTVMLAPNFQATPAFPSSQLRSGHHRAGTSHFLGVRVQIPDSQILGA